MNLWTHKNKIYDKKLQIDIEFAIKMLILNFILYCN